MEKNNFKNIDEYIGSFSGETQKKLNDLRRLIRESAPDAKEKISYQMPAFELHGILVYFAGYKNHIGFYPGAAGIESFRSELNDYKTSKGTVQFPIDKPLPNDLIIRIVKFRVEENIARKNNKKRKP